MKKSIIMTGIVLVSLTACSVEESSLGSQEKEGITVNFLGHAYTDTKISIGDQSPDSKWPVLWSEGDRIGIISRVETTFMNAPADINSADAGSNTATFILTDPVEGVPSQDVVIYYPYSSYTNYSEGCINSFVTMEQKQARPGDTSHLGRYTTAYDAVSINADGLGEGQTPSAEFSLTHPVAYVRFAVSSSEFASYSLEGVSLYCKDAAIAGDMAVSLEDGSITTETPRSYATVTIEEPAALSSTQEVWLVALPVDLTGKDVYASVSMTDGKEHVTIPRKLSLGELKANAVNTITLDNISESDAAAYPWYETHETRYLAGGWAYGLQNTFLATTDDEEITFDVKARGYFNGCREPKYARVSYTNNLSPNHACLMVNGICPTDGTLNAPDYRKDVYVDIASDYNLTVKVNSPSNSSYVGWFGKVVICDENKEDLWAYTIWYCPGGVGEQQYQNGVVMDRNIGNGYAPDNSTWHSVGAYYQWGRPFAFSWGSVTFESVESTNVTDLGISCSKPGTFFKTDGASNHGGDWYLGDHTGLRTDRKDDLWGNANSEALNGSAEKGVKSIFDPCPEGWMVASPAIIREVATGKAADFTTIGNVKYMTYDIGGGVISYYPFSGLKWASSGGNPTNNTTDIVAVWSNSSWGNYTSSDNNVYCLYYREANGWSDNGGRAAGYNVRCMKDDDNR